MSLKAFLERNGWGGYGTAVPTGGLRAAAGKRAGDLPAHPAARRPQQLLRAVHRRGRPLGGRAREARPARCAAAGDGHGGGFCQLLHHAQRVRRPPPQAGELPPGQRNVLRPGLPRRGRLRVPPTGRRGEPPGGCRRRGRRAAPPHHGGRQRARPAPLLRAGALHPLPPEGGRVHAAQRQGTCLLPRRAAASGRRARRGAGRAWRRRRRPRRFRLHAREPHPRHLQRQGRPPRATAERRRQLLAAGRSGEVPRAGCRSPLPHRRPCLAAPAHPRGHARALRPPDGVAPAQGGRVAGIPRLRLRGQPRADVLRVLQHRRAALRARRGLPPPGHLQCALQEAAGRR